MIKLDWLKELIKILKTKNSRNVCLEYTNLIIFQARQILEVEFERLVTEGTHRQLGIPSDGRNSASSMGSLGDRSISPVSWDMGKAFLVQNLTTWGDRNT